MILIKIEFVLLIYNLINLFYFFEQHAIYFLFWIKILLNINKNIDNKKINKSNLISKFINVNKKNKSVGEINENKSLLNELNFKMKDSQFIRSNIRKRILEKGRLIRKNIINNNNNKKKK